MKPILHIKPILMTLFVILSLMGFATSSALGAYDCTNGASDPPFLAAGVSPNLMLLIDNSASMYDMAYTGDSSNCYDGTDYAAGTESYDSATVYGGYFKTDTWYNYDTTSQIFEATGATACTDPTGGAAYQQTGQVCVTVTGETLTFAARGNFMNWATASKFDIQKQVLTGGKFDDAADTLTSEGRGCSGNRFIKQVIVVDSSGTTNYLNLGVHPLSPFNAASPDETTAIDLFQITETGFNNTACNEAVELMADENTSLGQLKGLIDECMEYANNQSYTSAEGPAFNQAVQSCWWWDKHGYDPEDDKSQHAVSIRNHCEDLYETQDPAFIGPSSPGYVCASAFVGNCWVPEIVIVPGQCDDLTCELQDGDYIYTNGDDAGELVDIAGGDRCTAGIVEYCSGNYKPKQNSCNKDWLPKSECPDTGVSVPGHWVVTDTDACVTQGLYDFCGQVELPQVVDPSDQTAATGEVYNLPAMLTDTGVSGQLGDPLLTMTGVIYDNAYATERPTGILHEFANDIRMGAMKFNYDGAQAECALRDEDAAADPKLASILYECDSTIDGGKVITEINDVVTDPDHIDKMVASINDIKANAWTPLAEAVFNAVGYYTQRSDMRLNNGDFPIASPEPCTAWCQSNNILVITEGASTADLHTTVTTFATVAGQNDGDTDTAVKCNDLYGSSYLDDITYYGFNGSNIHLEDPYNAEEHFQNIKTYFVVAGTPRAQGVGECSPVQMMADAALNGGTDAPYYADDPQDLNEDLKTVFNVIRAGAAAGSAASVISATRGGEGAIYQAIFWPAVDGPMVNGELKHEVTWTGEVHSLLIDAYGKLFEDTDGSDSLTGSDEQVVFYFDADDRESKACDQDLEDDGTCGGTSKPLHEVKYLWSAAEWLAGISDAALETNRTTIVADTKKRYIYTWNDLNNDGKVQDTEMLPFEPRNDWSAAALPVTDRAPVPIDFGVETTSEVNRIINWVRGIDNIGDSTLRPREVPTPTNFNVTGNPATITWRLGDVVHSTPTAVSRPAEGYHLLYQDGTYAEYFDEHEHRRHVIYFGGNDGMVHALNAGFYDENNLAFRRSYDKDTHTFSDTGPELGAELWAYVPYNLLPHLKCMLDPEYQHKYFVDLKPRIFDVQIFESSPDTLGHVKGWGTIMVVGMRFGGARTTAQDIIDEVSPGAYTDSRVFTSAYMVFDISDPLTPRLLGEMTYDDASSVDLAYTAAVPAVVPIKDDADTSDWYLILGSGPTDVTGVSNQKPRIGMFPLSLFDTPSTNAFRIPTTSATITHTSAGSYVLDNSANGFIADTVTVDYDLDELFKADVVYFGTVEGDWGSWGGRLYRWITDESDPQSWKEPAQMIDAQRPVSAAPTIGYDGTFYWVYFGTGRFYDIKDKSDYSQEYFFGLKEPVDADTGEFTWSPVANVQTDTKPSIANDAGSRTLLPVGGIEVEKANDPAFATLNCETGQEGCLPTGVSTFADLQEYIVGTCVKDTGCSGADGWVMDLEDLGERNLGQGALLGGLMTFTTYKPYQDVCKPEGDAFLYGVYFQTGTAFYEPVFTTQSGGGTQTGDTGATVVTSRLSIGRGLATTPNLHVGRQEGSKAFVQTSTGTIVEIPQPNLPIKNTKSGKMTWKGTCE